MFKKVISYLIMIVMVLGILGSIKLPGNEYVGNYISTNLFGVQFNKMVCIVVVLLTLFLANKYNNKKMFHIYKILFSGLIIISFLSSLIFK